MPNSVKFAMCLSLLIVWSTSVGCQDDGFAAHVSGQVKVDGQLAEKGSISFMPVNGDWPTTGGEIVAGRYQAPVPVGESVVEIRIPRKTGSRKLYDTPDSPVQDTFEEVLPAKYNRHSELRFTAEVGDNVKDWDLNSQAK